MEVYIGCCGFPVGMEKYFKEFSVVELQSTFYKLPKPETVRKWRESAPKDFKFLVKAFQGISHPTTSPTWKRSGLKKDEIENLKDKVGFLKPTKEVLNFWTQALEVCKILDSPVCLIQLPASFKENEENIENAGKFFSKIERDEISIALELRGWSKEGFKKLCKEFDLISCVDPFASVPVYFSSKKIAYFRLHGSYEKGRINYKYKFTDKDLQQLKRIVEGLKVKKAFVLFNNVFMHEDALKFKRIFQK
jgi:uncharacterized protein YecE (DUF72 family)